MHKGDHDTNEGRGARFAPSLAPFLMWIDGLMAVA